MSLWLVRAGSVGEYEEKFLQESRIFLTWSGLNVNLADLGDRGELRPLLETFYPDQKVKTLSAWGGQIWSFTKNIQIGDWIAMPSKFAPVIHFGVASGNYQFDNSAADPYYHFRSIQWFASSVRRSDLPDDIRLSLGSTLTICRIARNDAEARIKAIVEPLQRGIEPPQFAPLEDVSLNELDFEAFARDEILKLIASNFKEHKFTRLVEAILNANGYTTYMSPAGPDGGADILAGFGPLGFNQPRLCVEVKSGEAETDRPTVDKLIGAVTKFEASEGLFVSWGGFKKNVQRELAGSYFVVRLWGREEFLEAFIAAYPRLPLAIREAVPLKQISVPGIAEL